MQTARDNGEGESEGLVVSEGTFMTENIRRYQGLGADHQSNRELFEEFYAESRPYLQIFENSIDT